VPDKLMKRLEKSTLCRARPIGGRMTSVTSELAILAKDPPMTIPTAISITLPRMANFLNSPMMFLKYIKIKIKIVSPLFYQKNKTPASSERIPPLLR